MLKKNNFLNLLVNECILSIQNVQKKSNFLNLLITCVALYTFRSEYITDDIKKKLHS